MENRYDKYKDSGIAWIGEIPEHWEVIDLKYLSDIRGRIGFRGYTVSDLVSEGEGAFVIGGKHINQCVLNMESPDYISWDKYYESPEIMVSKGDIVMAQRGTLGKVAIIEYDINEATINPSLVLIKNIKCQGKFLYYYLNSESTLTLISILNTATAVPMISQNQIENMPIPIPSSAEQQSIANYLDQKCGEIDELIALQEEMITKLQSYKQSVITEVVTKGLDKNVPLKDSGVEWIGEIPIHWKIIKIKQLLKNNSLKVGPFGSQLSGSDILSEGKYWVYNQRTVLDNNFSSCNLFITSKKYNDLIGFKVSSGDILLTTRGTIGKISRVPLIFNEGVIHPCIIRFNIDESFIKYKILKYIFNDSDLVINQVKYNSNSTTIDVIYSDTLKNIVLAYIPREEQPTIANYLDLKCSEIDELISIKQQKIEKLKDYKKSLIFECVTGKRKV